MHARFPPGAGDVHAFPRVLSELDGLPDQDRMGHMVDGAHEGHMGPRADEHEGHMGPGLVGMRTTRGPRLEGLW